MRIAVLGAGIGGLVVAVGLQADGHQVTVVEQRQTPNPVGAGLTLFRNAFEALDVLDLGDLVRGISSSAISTIRAGQRHPSGSWLITVPESGIGSLRSVHRVKLHQALLEQLEPGTLHTGQAALVPPDGSPQLRLGNQVQDFDLIVAADGIRSRNRATLGLDAGLHYAGYTAWRGVTKRPVNIRDEAGETWGQGRTFGIVPLPHNQLYWFATLNTPAGTQFRDDYQAAREHFKGWHEPIPDCILATEPKDVLRHDIYDLAGPLTSLVRGRTVLLGDAAHAMTPNLGQGACQAIEDAATLVLLLRGTTTDGIAKALSKYSALRQKRTRNIMRQSRLVGRVAQIEKPVLVALRNTALRLTPGSVLAGLSHRIHDWPKPSK